ncbi:MAG TPA: O-antigen ligase family protein, partial [bacterium]|nr:O-antigen ligase family protein [bacterium]
DRPTRRRAGNSEPTRAMIRPSHALQERALLSLIRVFDRTSWLAVLTAAFLVPVLHIPACLNPFEIPKIATLGVLICVAYGLGLPVWLFEKRWRGQSFATSLPVLVLTLLAVLATVFSIHPQTSWQGSFARQNGTRTLVLFVAWYFLVRFSLCHDEGRRSKMLLWAFVLAGVPMCLYGVLQHFGLDLTTGFSFGERARPHGTLAYVNLLAGYLSFLLPLIGLLLLNSKRGKTRTMLCVLFVAAWYLLLATYCRGAWLAVLLFCATALLGLLFWIRRRVRWRRLAVVPALMVLGTLLFYGLPWLVPQSLQESADMAGVTQRTPAQRLASSFDFGELTVASRLHMWRIALDITAEYPWFGSGPETFVFLVPTRRTLQHVEYFGRRGLVENAHNEILHLAANTGLLAVAAYLWMLIAHFLHVVKGVRMTSDSKRKTTLGALALILIAYLTRSQVNVNSVENSLFFWTVLGLFAAYNVREQKPIVCSKVSSYGWKFGALAACPVTAIVLICVLIRPYQAGVLGHRAAKT